MGEIAQIKSRIFNQRKFFIFLFGLNEVQYLNFISLVFFLYLLLYLYFFISHSDHTPSDRES